MNEQELIEKLQTMSAADKKMLLELLAKPKKHYHSGIVDLKMEYPVILTLKCRLCDHEQQYKKMSSVNKPILISTTSCPSCRERLLLRTKEEILDLLLAHVDYARNLYAVDAKLFPYRHVEARHEVEEEHDSSGEGRVQPAEEGEVSEEEVDKLLIDAGVDPNAVPSDEEIERVGDSERFEET